jgi:peptidoglycan/LPS O-acetylase OafA/YrhL
MGQGYLLFYPLYDLPSLQVMFTMGTWTFIYILDLQVSILANKKFDAKVYEWLMGLSYYLYASHYLWLAIVVKVFVLNTNMSFAMNTFLVFVLTILMSVITYWLFLNCFRRCRKKCAVEPTDNDIEYQDKPPNIN